MISSNKQKPRNNFFLDLLFLISPFPVFIISGRSMEPTLHDGQRIVISKLAYVLSAPQIGDVVAIKDPCDQKVLIKRIERIENEKYFVVGDNKLHSTDSRKFGMLERRAIVGKVLI